MKKLILNLFFISSISFFFIACEKDDSNTGTPGAGTPITTANLTGTWDANLEISSSFLNNNLVSKDTTFYGPNFNLTAYLRLNSDGTGYYVEKDAGTTDSTSFTYVINSNSTVTVYSALDTSISSVVLNGNNLTTTDEYVFGNERYVSETRYTKR